MTSSLHGFGKEKKSEALVDVVGYIWRRGTLGTGENKGGAVNFLEGSSIAGNRMLG